MKRSQPEEKSLLDLIFHVRKSLSWKKIPWKKAGKHTSSRSEC